MFTAMVIAKTRELAELVRPLRLHSKQVGGTTAAGSEQQQLLKPSSATASPQHRHDLLLGWELIDAPSSSMRRSIGAHSPARPGVDSFTLASHRAVRHGLTHGILVSPAF